MKKPIYISTLLFFLSFYIFSQDTINPDGFNVFYYSNGNISSEGTLINGKPDGYWKTYYDNGQLKSEGNRSNFFLDSVWTFYNDTGKIILKITYENNLKNGYRTTYHEDEILKEYFVNDIKESWSYLYYPDGKLKRKVFFIDGLEEKIGKEYAQKDQRIIQLIYFKKGFITDIQNINRFDYRGRKTGKWKEFYGEDSLKLEGDYKADMKHGYFKYYDKNGNLLKVEKYTNGILEEDPEELVRLEIKKEYYPSGIVKISASYKNDIAEGIRREYDEVGNIMNGSVYKDGKKVADGITNEEGLRDGSWKLYYISGSLKAEGVYNKGNRVGAWKFYHSNGQIEQTGSYTNDGKEDGTWTWYYDNGNLLREENYFLGMRDGLSVEYNPDGDIIAEGEYIEDFKEGFWIIDYGDHKEEGSFLYDEKNGEWIHYYSDGSISYKGSFIDGNPHSYHQWYWPNGNIKKEGEYINGLKTGEWKKYNFDGTEFIVIYYKNGKEIRYDGIKIQEITE